MDQIEPLTMKLIEDISSLAEKKEAKHPIALMTQRQSMGAHTSEPGIGRATGWHPKLQISGAMIHSITYIHNDNPVESKKM